MKISIPILLVFCALSLPVATARADVAQGKFEQSLAVPLSRAESAQLTSLMKAATPSASYEAGEALEEFEISKRLRTPAEVREQRPKGATTLYAGKFPIGIGGKPVLIHIWTAAPHTPDSNYAFDPAPCYVDAFTKANGKSAQWRRVARSMFMGDGYPDKDGVIPHFLYVHKQQAPVLYLESHVYMHTDCIVVTYPKGIGTSQTTVSYAQDLSQSGGWIDTNGFTGYGFGTDKRGMLTITVGNRIGGKYKGDGTLVKTVLAWNGREYAKAPAQTK